MGCTLTCFRSTSFFYLKRSRTIWFLKMMWLTHSTESQWWQTTITMRSHDHMRLSQFKVKLIILIFAFIRVSFFYMYFRTQLFCILWPSCTLLLAVTWSHGQAYNDPATCHGSRRSPEGFLLIGGPGSHPHYAPLLRAPVMPRLFTHAHPNICWLFQNRVICSNFERPHQVRWFSVF